MLKEILKAEVQLPRMCSWKVIPAFLAFTLILALLTSCGKSDAQIACEENNGEWHSKFSHYNYIWISDGKGGGYNSLIPVFDYFCIQRNDG